MKIKKVETFVLKSSFNDPIGWSMGWFSTRCMVLTKITTDEGLVGWGEGGVTPCALIVNEMLSPQLLGEDPMNINKLWHKMYVSLHNAGYVGGFGGDAISSVDIALWDIAGKASGKSIAQLMGGVLRDKIPVYATGLYYYKDDPLKKLLKEAEGYVENGFKAMKMKIGGASINDDIARVKAMREVIGDNILLMVDANQAYNASSAIQMGKRLGDLDVRWFEEPVVATDIEAYLTVKNGQPVPVAGGELLRNRYDAKEVVGRRAVDILQPDVERAGGVTEVRNIAAMANAFGIMVNLHSWGSAINIAAALNISATLPTTPYSRDSRPFEQVTVMEFDQSENPMRTELCDYSFVQKDGYAEVPNGPGLGININEHVVEKHCVQKFLAE